MKIYVASSWRNERQQDVVAALREAGHEVYDFKNPPGGTGFGWRQATDEPPPWSAERTREVLALPVARAGFHSDFTAMQWADAIVMVQPCGRSAALELGWGCGAGKVTAVLLADGQEPELMLKCARHLCTSLDEVMKVLAPPCARCKEATGTHDTLVPRLKLCGGCYAALVIGPKPTTAEERESFVADAEGSVFGTVACPCLPGGGPVEDCPDCDGTGRAPRRLDPTGYVEANPPTLPVGEGRVAA